MSETQQKGDSRVPEWLRREVRIARRRPLRHNWWALRNWWSGLRFCPIGRCRYCDHTTPHHYPTCRTKADG